MKILLESRMAGPDGGFAPGTVLSVPDDVSNEDAMALLNGGFASAVSSAAGAGEMETATMPAAETATAPKKRTRTRAKPKAKASE